MPLRPRLAPLALAAILGWPIAAGAVNLPEFFPGTYEQVGPVTKKPLPVGSTVVIVRAKSGKLGFSLNAVRALDSNQGFIAGSFAPAGRAVWTQKSESGDCKLTFAAVTGGLTVVQDMEFGDCGFGAGVTASGTYAFVTEKR
jgi:hypothetical protein